MSDRVCCRCGRPAPDQDSDDYLDWEAADGGESVICPGCLTNEELLAMAEDMALVGWWSDLTDDQRATVLPLHTGDPLPRSAVRSLLRAGVILAASNETVFVHEALGQFLRERRMFPGL